MYIKCKIKYKTEDKEAKEDVHGYKTKTENDKTYVMRLSIEE